MKEELKKMVSEMMDHAKAAWEIGGQISSRLCAEDDRNADAVFDIINEIQCCEREDLDEVVEELLQCVEVEKE